MSWILEVDFNKMVTGRFSGNQFADLLTRGLDWLISEKARFKIAFKAII